MIGSYQKCIGSRKKFIALLQTLLQSEFKSLAELVGGTQSGITSTCSDPPLALCFFCGEKLANRFHEAQAHVSHSIMSIFYLAKMFCAGEKAEKISWLENH